MSSLLCSALLPGLYGQGAFVCHMGEKGVAGHMEEHLLDLLFYLKEREEGEDPPSSHHMADQCVGHVLWGQGSSEGPLILWKDPERPEMSR